MKEKNGTNKIQEMQAGDEMYENTRKQEREKKKKNNRGRKMTMQTGHEKTG